jgi:hypothetical protein
VVRSQLRQIVLRPYLQKNPSKRRTGGEHLPSKHETLSSNPSAAKKKKKSGKTKETQIQASKMSPSVGKCLSIDSSVVCWQHLWLITSSRIPLPDVRLESRRRAESLFVCLYLCLVIRKTGKRESPPAF